MSKNLFIFIIIVAVLILAVQIITEVIKKSMKDKNNYNILVVGISLLLTVATIIASCQILKIMLTWYIIVGSVVLSFFIAYGAMLGYDKLLSRVFETIKNIKNTVDSVPEQKGGASTMTFAKWVNTYLGKKTDWDGVYGVQCVDLIDCYIDKCLGLKKGFWGNAKYWWLNRNKSAWLKNNFDFITPSYKNGELKVGDIAIRTSGTYGHIFIIAEPTANGKVKYYDQNADGKGAAMTLRVKPYTSAYINGILRPKNQSVIGAVSTSATNPTFKKGDVITLTTNLKVRTGAGTNYAQKKRSQLTADGQKHAQTGTYGVLLKGTRVTLLETKKVGNDIWGRCPSGWIALYYQGSIYAK